MKTTLLLFLVSCCLSIKAQTTADFESFELNPGEFLNGSDLSGGFSDGEVFLPNSYNENYASWTGWAISATTDTETPGFTNQYSAITGGGFEGSTGYAVRYDFVPSIMNLSEIVVGSVVNGLYVTNSTYAYLSMRDGDAYAKRFGGESGDDPDYFLLTIKGFANGEATTDSVDFYLADYRADNAADDYLIDEWTWVELTSLGPVDSLWFNLTSTDIGQFGMNTPAYFCIDNVVTNDASTSTIRGLHPEDIRVFPNPASDAIYLDMDIEQLQSIQNIQIFNTSGQLLQTLRDSGYRNHVDISQLPTGTFIAYIITAETTYLARFTKFSD